MLAKLLSTFLFNLVHLVITVLVAVQNVYGHFWTKRTHSTKEEVTKCDIKYILENGTQVRNKLHHLVMMSDTCHHTLGDLAFIIIWSLIVGVPYVSLYDVTGCLSEREEKLFLEVEKRKKGIPGCIKWAKMPDLNGYTNGAQANTVIVNIFRHEDGRPKIARSIQTLAAQETHCVNDYTTQDLDNALSLVYPSIPDPELVLYTGPMCCTYGLLPWQIRLTEFVQLSVNNSVNIQSYLGALHKYSKCDQRFGK